jgi:hypothetical protein
MKTLSIEEAKKAGFRVCRYGLSSYLPVALPREVVIQDFQDLISSQFDPSFEAGAITTGERTEGYFTQVIEDVHGRFGIAGTLYIVRANYSENDGVQDWDVYGAVKIS